jgi:hypothetical protein
MKRLNITTNPTIKNDSRTNPKRKNPSEKEEYKHKPPCEEMTEGRNDESMKPVNDKRT